jgi:hypothetical protein
MRLRRVFGVAPQDNPHLFLGFDHDVPTCSERGEICDAIVVVAVYLDSPVLGEDGLDRINVTVGCAPLAKWLVVDELTQALSLAVCVILPRIYEGSWRRLRRRLLRWRWWLSLLLLLLLLLQRLPRLLPLLLSLRLRRRLLRRWWWSSV